MKSAFKDAAAAASSGCRWQQAHSSRRHNLRRDLYRHLHSITAAAELHIAPNRTAIAKFDGAFSAGAQTYAGTATLKYSWRKPQTHLRRTASGDGNERPR